MSDAVNLWKEPQPKETNMIVGWRQWADAGSVSSGLPEYLIERLGAKKIGEIRSSGFYLFQFPGTHHLVRPVVKFEAGLPVRLDTPTNEFYFAENDDRGLVLFLGDEPQLDVERYVEAVLKAAENLSVRRIIGLGGVYGEFPYDRERMISCSFSLPGLKDELKDLAVQFTDYEGGASIGSYMCKRAGERNMEYVGLYAFAPAYDLTNLTHESGALTIENDYVAWLAIMKRLVQMLGLDFELADLEGRSEQLVKVMDERVREMDNARPEVGIADYFRALSDEFEETVFEPLDEMWQEELRRLFDKYDEEEEEDEE